MKRSSIGHGVYSDENGKFWVRPWVNGRRTWRKLEAVKQKYAIEEARAKLSDHSRSKVGTVRSPFAAVDGSFRELSEAYVAASCPNKRLEGRPGEFTKNEALRIESLVGFFGTLPVTAIKLPLMTRYATWRRTRLVRGTSGNRSIDMELVTLSNVLSYGVAIGQIEYNPIAQGRPKFQTRDKIKRSRERAISSGDDLHKLADVLFSHPKSEAMGWLVIFSGLTGCRNVELLRFRVDGSGPECPGWISGNHLFLRRAKGGVHPWIELKGPLAEAVECFQYWHADRFPKDEHYSPWWFPGQSLGQMRKDSFRHALYRACERSGVPRCAPHGFRSFYVTLRRSEGASDVQIASEIGDKTVSIISETYGDVPPNWTGQTKLSFLPSEGLPSWERWKPEHQKVVGLK